MKLVGATDSFIRRPFLVEGIAQGLLAGVIAALILSGVYSLIFGFLPETDAASSTAALVVTVGIILCGVALGWIGSLFAVRRFLHRAVLR